MRRTRRGFVDQVFLSIARTADFAVLSVWFAGYPTYFFAPPGFILREFLHGLFKTRLITGERLIVRGRLLHVNNIKRRLETA